MLLLESYQIIPVEKNIYLLISTEECQFAKKCLQIHIPRSFSGQTTNWTTFYYINITKYN